jgi:hypothetical protein
MAKKHVLVSYGVDIDAVAGWLGSYGGEDSSSDISRGTFPPISTSFSANQFPQVSSQAQLAPVVSSNSLKRTT